MTGADVGHMKLVYLVWMRSTEELDIKFVQKKRTLIGWDGDEDL